MAYVHWSPSVSNAAQGSTAVANPAGPSAVMVNNRRRDFRKMVLRDGLLTPVTIETPSTSSFFTGNSAIPAAQPAGVRVVLVDVAPDGVGLRCRHELTVGQCFSMTVPGHPEYDTPCIRIVRSRPGRGSEFELGAEFC